MEREKTMNLETSETAWDADAQAAAMKAEELFRQGAACSQAVVLVHCERLGLSTDVASNVALGLGGGVGRMREVCGCVTGMALLAGLARGTGGVMDANAKRETYADVQALAKAFKTRFGSCICREILASRQAGEAVSQDTDSTPGARTPAYYQAHSTCLDCVRYAAALATQIR